MLKKLIIIGIAICCLVGLETFLRVYYGFCDAVLMAEDPDYEYIAMPDQERFRFRHHIKYNSQSMRSDEVDSTAYIILGFGDSVINGGVLTDHDSLATTILSDTLSKLQGKKVQFLNISAGSWGPDNCFAYLMRHGNFEAKSIYLFVSSHDAYDNMNFEKIVDIDPAFPSKQYSSAIFELVHRYLMPRIANAIKRSPPNGKIEGTSITTTTADFNTGFGNFLSYASRAAIPLTVYLHASREEVESGSYNEYGQEIIKFVEENDLKLILGLKENQEKADFRDGIHINSRGQRKLAMCITKYFKFE